jgi:hypothetical protein
MMEEAKQEHSSSPQMFMIQLIKSLTGNILKHTTNFLNSFKKLKLTKIFTNTITPFIIED